jgi:hypothetical protein
MTQESLVTSDKLSFPLDALWKEKEKLTSLDEGSKAQMQATWVKLPTVSPNPIQQP